MIYALVTKYGRATDAKTLRRPGSVIYLLPYRQNLSEGRNMGNKPVFMRFVAIFPGGNTTLLLRP